MPTVVADLMGFSAACNIFANLRVSVRPSHANNTRSRMDETEQAEVCENGRLDCIYSIST